MYRTEKTVTRIKETAKTNGVKISEMLSACGLNINTLSSMNNRGSWLQANSLAMIADYLKVSVDYLLGRTDSPTIEQLEVKTIENLSIIINGTEYQLVQADEKS